MSGRLVRINEELEALRLTPEQRQFVRLYTDPLLPTFGNAAASARGAGVPERTARDWIAKDTHVVRQAIALIEAERDAVAADIRNQVVRHAPDAARELVQQLSAGRDLHFVDVNAILKEMAEIEERLSKPGAIKKATRENLARRHRELASRADKAARHNKVVLEAFSARRAAAARILDYALLHGGGRGGERKGQSPLDLSQLTTEELAALRGAIDAVRRARAEAPTVEADFVIED